MRNRNRIAPRALTVFSLAIASSGLVRAQVTVVNVTPQGSSAETQQNSEPSIGVNQAANAQGQVTVSAFNNSCTAVPQGDVVLVADNNKGQGGFFALGNGTKVAANISLPWSRPRNFPPLGARPRPGASLGHQRIGGDLAIAVDPNLSGTVYVAYVQAIQVVLVINWIVTPLPLSYPQLCVRVSTDGGQTFCPIVYQALIPPGDLHPIIPCVVRTPHATREQHERLPEGRVVLRLISSSYGEAGAPGRDKGVFSCCRVLTHLPGTVYYTPPNTRTVTQSTSPRPTHQKICFRYATPFRAARCRW